MKNVISERGKKNSKTFDTERYQFNQLNFLKMLQNNLNLEYFDNLHNSTENSSNCKLWILLKEKKKKEKKFSFSNHEKLFLGRGYFQWVCQIRGNKNILFLALLCLQFLFMNTVLARIFWGFMLPDNTVYLLPCPWIVSSKSGSLKMKTSSLST